MPLLCEEVHQTLKQEEQRADIGELAGPLAHEFSNLLNSLLLHLTVLEPDLPPDAQEEAEEIRRQAQQVSKHILQFQLSRQVLDAEPSLLDLNAIVQEAASQIDPRIRLDCQLDLPPIEGRSSDVRRLCRFLFKNAVAAAGNRPVRVRTESTGERVRLHVEDAGPALSPEAVRHLFETGEPVRAGTSPLELASCKSLARRGDASIRGQAGAEGGAHVTVEWAAAEADE